MAKITFNAKIQQIDPTMGAWAQIVLPKAAAARLGSKARVPITGTVNGFPIRTSAFPTGDGTHQFMTNQAMLAGAKAGIGDRVEVAIEVDEKLRPVAVPPELKKALAGSKTAIAAYEKLPLSHRREIAGYVAEAKQVETRQRRVAKTLAALRTGSWKPR